MNGYTQKIKAKAKIDTEWLSPSLEQITWFNEALNPRFHKISNSGWISRPGEPGKDHTFYFYFPMWSHKSTFPFKAPSHVRLTEAGRWDELSWVEHGAVTPRLWFNTSRPITLEKVHYVFSVLDTQPCLWSSKRSASFQNWLPCGYPVHLQRFPAHWSRAWEVENLIQMTASRKHTLIP